MSDFNAKLEEGKKCFSQNKFRDALVQLVPCAENGNVEAQAIVGFIYFMGNEELSRDLNEAVRWLTKATTGGSGEAAHNLATLYLTCEPELPRNPKEARRLYLEAKRLGFQVAPDEWYEKLRDE